MKYSEALKIINRRLEKTRAQIGEVRLRAGGDKYVKTSAGWQRVATSVARQKKREESSAAKGKKGVLVYSASSGGYKPKHEIQTRGKSSGVK